jgi:carboxylesterase
MNKTIKYKIKRVFVGFSVFITVSLIVSIFVVLYSCKEHTEISQEKLKNFQIYADQQLVKNAASKTSFKLGKKPLKEIVLLLHSFSTSPEDYRKIFQLLDEKNIPYYAPTILGFGLTDTDLLEKIEAEDWIRDAINHYNICKELADEVHIVGQSLGGLLATIIASQKKVGKLVILSPAFYFKGKALEAQKEFESSFWKRWFFEHVKKYVSIHPEIRSIFRYESLPFRSLMALVKLQYMAIQSPKNIQVKSVDILYGKNDELVNVEKALECFRKKSIAYSTYSYNSPHSLFIESDYDQEKVVKDLGDIFEK